VAARLGSPRLHLRATDSTNERARALAQAGAPHGTLVTAGEQSAGRGRQGRRWSAPAGSALLMSLILRDPPRLTPLAAAVAVAVVAGEDARIKWPNDVQVDGRKLAGILTERAGDALVLGVGLNVSLRDDELPTADATSLQLEGSPVVDRPPVLLSILRSLGEGYAAFEAAAGDAGASGLRAAYVELCATLGRDVRVELPGGRTVTGTAADIDAEGRLVLTGPAGDEAVGAGDVVHLR
jgi:BirA family transcriptional regulator, biotin operon repressor / biotin---[acetyl-CoA-carboxylase] ligase